MAAELPVGCMFCGACARYRCTLMRRSPLLVGYYTARPEFCPKEAKTEDVGSIPRRSADGPCVPIL